MTALPKKKIYTPEEYLALEENCEYRSEYENGEIIGMAGSSFDHAQITSNVSRFIGNKAGENCSSLPNDMKVWVEKLNKFYYPDVTIICGKPVFYGQRTDVIINPVLLVEVLSKSTEAKDRGEKFLAYQTLESLKEYVLISQDKNVVERFVKESDGKWSYFATIGLKSKVKLESLKIELTFEEISQRVDFNIEENL